MDLRERTISRISFTKALRSLNALMDQEKSSTVEIKSAFEGLERRYQELEEISKKILEEMFIAEDIEDEDLEKTSEENLRYESQFLTARCMFEERMASIQEKAQSVSSSGNSTSRARCNLPKVELAKFSGDIREWLKFWSLFSKIHEDTGLRDEDKFQYLMQSMVPGSRAADLVNSYPPVGENYQKAIEGLTKRFGREDLQIEVYVRELLQLVLENAVAKKKVILASLYDRIESYIRALETLGVTTDKCAAMLYPLVESSLPEDLLRVWQRSNSAAENGNVGKASNVSKTRLDGLIRFLESEVQNELRISMAVKGFDIGGKPERERKAEKNLPSARNLLASVVKEDKCVFCEKTNHMSEQCFKAEKMPLSEKQEAAKIKRVCFGCLKSGHLKKHCRSKLKCSKCGKRHVDIMCPGRRSRPSSRSDSESSVSAVNIPKECALASSAEIPATFMQTLRVRVRNEVKDVVVRALIDTGSQNSYVLSKLAEKLDYKPHGQQDMVHLLFGGSKSDVATHQKFQVRVGNLDGTYWCNFEALGDKVICSNVPCVKRGAWLEELKKRDIIMSDVDSEEECVSILIGADIAGKLLTGRLHQTESGLTAVETHLGWTLMGKMPPKENAENKENLAVLSISMLTKDVDIKDLWSLDVIGINDPIDHKSRKDHNIQVEQNFKESIVKNPEGRYEVKLPWLDYHPELKDNKSMAMQRLEKMVKKLREMQKFQEYDGIFREWLHEGIIEQVPAQEMDNWGVYLPHRPVFKEEATTKTRPIFDASAGSPSLNSCLERGPNLIEEVVDILLRFREGKIGVISDIKKAFLQISIDPVDRDFLRFLWYDAQGNLIMFRHCRVVFGVCSSPFMLGATISLHLENYLKSIESERGIFVSEYFYISKLKRSFYVDNCVASVDNFEQLADFKCKAKSVMETGLFDLRGWEYTHDNLNNVCGVLGLKWDKENDTLALNISNIEKVAVDKITKRVILSVAHRIFDPLGFVCPISLGPKILLQEAWAAKIGWDEEVNESIKKRFLVWIKELTKLSEVKIPRCMLGVNQSETDVEVSLHTFVDASKLAYAVVIFLRIQKGCDVQLRFVQAKTKVTPAKKGDTGNSISIPRLELLAATIGARLTRHILNAMDFKIDKVFYWSDSSTVITWINREDNWSVFVANRIKEIRNISEVKQWRHIPGNMNPADLPSRGCTVDQLLESRWWEGPDWLKKNEESWPNFPDQNIDETEVLSELKRSKIQNSALIALASSDRENMFSRYSSFSKATKVMGWIKRFIFNCENSALRREENFLTAKECREAERSLLKMIQREKFNGVTDEKIRELMPFMDSDGVIRTRSKISFREDNFDFRCPIILPEKDHLIECLIREKHIDLKHAGVTITLAVLREKFWIIKGRKVVRKVIQKCVDCRRHDAKAIETNTPPLPLNRVRKCSQH
ncbi:uncharacterized protein LOC123306696 [Coccinella septempunctata]|uniref:uncharacterized protein LOC123306696 n=1 Tax=Coccinella septempunctata TaxID=41139 RepID=UPI001D064D11|nr:uncharacterized protein LOC123306696 [Coccinella septempunctata]